MRVQGHSGGLKARPTLLVLKFPGLLRALTQPPAESKLQQAKVHFSFLAKPQSRAHHASIMHMSSRRFEGSFAEALAPGPFALGMRRFQAVS